MITNEQGRRQDDKERKGNTPKRIGNQKLKFLIIVITNEQGRRQDDKERKGNTPKRIGNTGVKNMRVREPKLNVRVVLLNN